MKALELRVPDWRVLACVVLGWMAIGTPVQAQEVRFGEVTAKFVRNMKLLQGMTKDAQIRDAIALVVAKAEDLQRYNNTKNADERRHRIMKQRDAMLKREGIEKSDQRKLEELQQELRELDADGLFGKARGEMSRAIGELQKQLGQVYAPDPETEDLLRLIRTHLNYYNRCLSRLPN